MKMNFIFTSFINQELQIDVFSTLLFLAILFMAGLSSIEFENNMFLLWGLSLFTLGAFEFSLTTYAIKIYLNNLIKKYLKNLTELKQIK